MKVYVVVSYDYEDPDWSHACFIKKSYKECIDELRKDECLFDSVVDELWFDREDEQARFEDIEDELNIAAQRIIDTMIDEDLLERLNININELDFEM